MSPNANDASNSSAKLYPALGKQILGFVIGLVGGLALGFGLVSLLIDLDRSPRSSAASFLLATVGLFQFLWLLPVAFYGWRKRNFGLILGVLLAAVPVIVLDAICFGPMYFDDGQY
ncbi:MAG: hypothetical protein HZA53_12140 [Planctomycetes bacterium]|nr:hypothetical protein [Planctomycetota bacterium]